jgi:hypothetical protein
VLILGTMAGALGACPDLTQLRSDRAGLSPADTRGSWSAFADAMSTRLHAADTVIVFDSEYPFKETLVRACAPLNELKHWMVSDSPWL